MHQKPESDSLTNQATLHQRRYGDPSGPRLVGPNPRRPTRVEDDDSACRVGATLCGKYRLDSILGVGGMATVYSATHRNQAELAIKMLHPGLDGDPSMRARFLREPYAANSVKHRGIVKIVDDGVTEDGAAFLVMERLSGATVEDLRCPQGKLSLHAAVAIVEQLLDVLAAAHAQGIVHRDVKPANLFVTRDGEVKVLDFGIARIREALLGGPSLTVDGTILGTPAYMAPEQAFPGVTEIDARTDVWGVGATLFALISGQNVHEGDTASALLQKAAREPSRSLATVAPRAPRTIAEVVDCALAFEKDRRWKSATEMRTALLAAYRLHFRRSPSRAILARRLDASVGTVTTTRKRNARAASEVAQTELAPPGVPAPMRHSSDRRPTRASITIAENRMWSVTPAPVWRLSLWLLWGVSTIALAVWVGR